MNEVIQTILVLCALSGSLAILLLIAEYFFANYGECEIDINNSEKVLKIQGGSTLLQSLNEEKVFLPSACGGRGSCGFCKCKVKDGAGPVLPTELPYLNEEELKNDTRLSCQIKVKENIRINVPEELLSVKMFETTVESITDLTHDIKGLRFKLPEGEDIKFKAGQYMQLMAPPYEGITESTYRAYSISSEPKDDNAVELIIRLVPEGIVTTYVFNHLKVNNKATLTGPYGDFYLSDTDAEIIFIAGGSGLAPIRSIVLDMITRGITNRKATFFFGASTTKDLYGEKEMEKLAEEHEWFNYVAALSNEESDDHSCEKGLITDIVGNHYEDTSEMEAYLCGSPGMIDACVNVLTAKGLHKDKIYYDKFS
ncbi:MAG: FAD-binding oxidoreductase [Planctomycetota bacterium]|jgi:Na+-transporting NADH:ubiquinone oxidoreductase subunit F